MNDHYHYEYAEARHEGQDVTAVALALEVAHEPLSEMGRC